MDIELGYIIVTWPYMGGSFLGVEISLIGFGPITVAAGRVTMAALILLVYTCIFGDGLPRFSSKTDKRVWVHCLGMALFTNANAIQLALMGSTNSHIGIRRH